MVPNGCIGKPQDTTFSVFPPVSESRRTDND